MTAPEPVKPLREVLEQARERLDEALRQLRSWDTTAAPEARSLRWRCRACRHIKFFTKSVPAHVATPCPKCRGIEFQTAD